MRTTGIVPPVRELARIPALRRMAMRGVRQRPEVVLFESWNGRYADNPRAISEELARRDLGLRLVWVAGAATETPAGVERVAPGSAAFLSALGEAGTIVTSNALPGYFRKRRGCTYLQTWHGTPLKRIAFDIDNDRFRAENRKYLENLGRDVGAWDALVSPNRFSTEIFRRAFRFDGPVLETGYPRNDLLVSSEAEPVRRRVRGELGVASGQRCVLYAPTWRDRADFRLRLDLDRLAAELPDVVVLLRMHPLVDRPAGLGDAANVRDVSDHGDLRELMVAADVLVSDYSSVMFDFAATRKPILLYVYDLDEYRDELRGFYFDIEADAPGPLVRTFDELLEALREPDAVRHDHAAAYGRFHDRFCHMDDGRASARVVDSLPFRSRK